MNLSLNGQKEQQTDNRKRSHPPEEERGHQKSTSSSDLSEKRNEEEMKCQRSTRKAAKTTCVNFSYLSYALSSDEESKSSGSDCNDDCDPAWTPAPPKVYQYKHI